MNALTTPAEYLEVEKTSKLKHEFYQGEVFAMTGGSPEHALIAANFIGIASRFEGHALCRLYR